MKSGSETVAEVSVDWVKKTTNVLLDSARNKVALCIFEYSTNTSMECKPWDINYLVNCDIPYRLGPGTPRTRTLAGIRKTWTQQMREEAGGWTMRLEEAEMLALGAGGVPPEVETACRQGPGPGKCLGYHKQVGIVQHISVVCTRVRNFSEPKHFGRDF
jgi:hypothetical protein